MKFVQNVHTLMAIIKISLKEFKKKKKNKWIHTHVKVFQ